MSEEPRDDKTEPIAPVEPALPSSEQTKELPSRAPAWSGRAEVPAAPGGLRDSAPYTVAEPPPSGGRTWWTPVLLGMLALGLLGLIVLAAWLMGRDVAPEPQATTPPPQLQSAVPTTVRPTSARPTTRSPTPSPTPRMIAVPVLVGMSQDDAKAELDRIGLSYDFDYRPSDRKEGTVIRTRPGAGEMVPPGTKILLIVSSGPGTTLPTLPATTPAGGD